MDTLYDKIMEIRKKGNIPFHMPGTKGGIAIPPEYKTDILNLDYTELGDTDNLRSPTGIIKEAQDETARIYGANKSYFLVNGGTGGIMSAMAYLNSKGGRILMDRNCHISAINAAMVLGMSLVFIMPEILYNSGFTGKIDPKKIKKYISENPDITGVFITSPNYYGIDMDIKQIAEICHKTGIILCVDSAHGAHYGFSPLLPENAIKRGADIAVMSVHKTMPSPTQTAIMHISDKIDSEIMQNMINMFQTTSPSYIFMAYIHYAVVYMKENGQEIYKKLNEYVKEFKKSIIGEIIETDDFTRIVINIGKTAKTGYDLAKYLREKYFVECEMADMKNVVCIVGEGNTKEHFEVLKKGCNEFYKIAGERKEENKIMLPNICKNVNFKNMLGEKTEYTKDYVNRISAVAVTVYPPGVAVVMPGEIITKEIGEYIDKIRKMGGKVIGMANDGIYFLVKK